MCVCVCVCVCLSAVYCPDSGFSSVYNNVKLCSFSPIGHMVMYSHLLALTALPVVYSALVIGLACVIALKKIFTALFLF